MVRQAQASYPALGGTDGEWIKTWDEEKRDEANEGNGFAASYVLLVKLKGCGEDRLSS